MTNRPLWLTLFGFLYGIVLLILSYFCMASGYGTSVPLLTASAPFGLFGFVAALAGAPILWALLGYLASRSAQTGFRQAFYVLCAFHYLTGLLMAASVLQNHDGWLEFMRLAEFAPQALIVWASVYVLGQWLMWSRVE
jgi:hypothetical protein